jgi:hypothetical protein
VAGVALLVLPVGIRLLSHFFDFVRESIAVRSRPRTRADGSQTISAMGIAAQRSNNGQERPSRVARVSIYAVELLLCGADDGNRTRVFSLGS